MKRIAAAVALALLTIPVYAQVKVQEAWVRATVGPQTATGAFMLVTAAKDTRLVAVRSPVAGIAEVHEMQMANNMMKMRPVEALPLPAGKTVKLEPSGYHIMLMELKAPLKEGANVPITLVVEGKDGKREDIEVQAKVRPLTARGSEPAGH